MSKTVMFFISLLIGVAILAAGWLIYEKTDLFDKLPWKKDEIEIAICDGSICTNNVSKKTSEMLIYKGDYPDIENFTEVHTSPDGKQICFLAQTIVPIWVYYAEADGTNVQEIALAENCVWSHDSEKFAFINHTTDVSPHNVFVYDITTDQTTNYTEDMNSLENMRLYENPVWSDDDLTLTSKYKQYDENWTETSGESKINVETGEITEI